MTVREVGFRGGVGDELAAVGAALERFVSRPRGERPGEVVRDEMVGWRRLIDRMELEFSGMGTELAACGEVEWLGHHSPTDWVKEECHLTGTAAWNALVVGEQAARMPESTRALVAGEIGYAHLTLMARTADWVAGLPVVAVDLLAAGRPDATAAGAADPDATPADAAASGAPLPPTFDEGALRRRAPPRLCPLPPRRRPPPLPHRAGRAGGGALPGAEDRRGRRPPPPGLPGQRGGCHSAHRPGAARPSRRRGRWPDPGAALCRCPGGARRPHPGQRSAAPPLRSASSPPGHRHPGDRPGAGGGSGRRAGPGWADRCRDRAPAGLRRRGDPGGLRRRLRGPRRGPGHPGAGDGDPAGGPGPGSGLYLAGLPPAGVVGRGAPPPPLGAGRLY